MQLLNLAKEQRQNKDIWFNLFLQRYDITMIKLLVGNSAVTEVINFTLKIFQMQVFHIYNLKSKWQSKINIKINVKTKGKICLALVLKKKKTPKKVSNK